MLDLAESHVFLKLLDAIAALLNQQTRPLNELLQLIESKPIAAIGLPCQVTDDTCHGVEATLLSFR